MGHVVCIKGISSHFKRWPGFSPPGTPVTHPLVHAPFKEPGTAAPLQPLSTVCVCAGIYLGENGITDWYCQLVILPGSIVHRYKLIEVSGIKPSVFSPAPEVFLNFFFLFFFSLCICSTFNKCRRWINRSQRMLFHQVCQCLVMDLLLWIQPLIVREDFWGMGCYLSVVLCLCVRPGLKHTQSQSQLLLIRTPIGLLSR